LNLHLHKMTRPIQHSDKYQTDIEWSPSIINILNSRFILRYPRKMPEPDN